MRTGAHVCWYVYLSRRLIDKVFYTEECGEEYVRNSLIDHDGYHPRIQVRKERQ